MPVDVVKQQKPEPPLYCDPLRVAAASQALSYRPPLNGNSLPTTLELYRRHHRACSLRRNNGLSYEIRVEAQHSEWLSRKYFDGVRQQQAISGRLDTQGASGSTNRGSTGGSECPEGMDAVKPSPGTPNKLLTALTGQNSKTIPDHKGPTDTNSNGSGSSVTNSNHSNSVEGGDGEDRRKSKLSSDTHKHSYNMTLNRGGKDQQDTNEGKPLGNVLIKREPDSMENTHTCNQSPTDKVCLRTGNRTPSKPRRFSFSKVDKSSSLSSLLGCSSDDAEDDLKLSADDVISGVISTPLIKPLEEGDVITTPSPPSVVGGNNKLGSNNSRSSQSTPPTNPNSAGGTPPPTSSSSNHLEKTQRISSAATAAGGGNGVTPAAVTGTRNKDSLKQDLDEFSKIMVQVEQDMHASFPQPSAADVYRTNIATSHIGAPPTQHTISPPPYYAPNRAHHQNSQSQVLYQSVGMVSTPVTLHQPGYPPPPPLTPTPVRRPSVQDASMYHHSRLEFTSLPSTMAVTHTQVDPSATYRQHHTTLRGAASDRVQKHPQLQHISASSHSIHPQPVLQSPPVRHSSLSQHLPSFPDPNSSMANQIPPPPPRTPTTPLEHFANFPNPSQVQSPTHAAPHPFFPSTNPQNYQFVHKPSGGDPLQSPTVTTANSINWGNSLQPPGSLKETLLAQVNSHLEVLTGQKRQSQEAGFGLPPAKIPPNSSLVHGPLADSMNMQHFPSTPMDSDFTGPPTNSQLLHTIPYQGHSTTTPYPHPHHPL